MVHYHRCHGYLAICATKCIAICVTKWYMAIYMYAMGCIYCASPTLCAMEWQIAIRGKQQVIQNGT